MLIVHLNVTLFPDVKPVIMLTFELGVVIVMLAKPLTKLHVPVPGAGALPVIVKLLVLHNVWSEPAVAVGAGAVFVNTISSKVVAQMPFPTVHLKVELVPAAIPVIVVVADVELVIVAVPENTVQVPLPTTGDVALIVNVLVLHCVMLAKPASAILAVDSFVNTTSSWVLAQTPLLIVHLNVTLLPDVNPVIVLTFEPGVVIVMPANPLT